MPRFGEIFTFAGSGRSMRRRPARTHRPTAGAATSFHELVIGVVGLGSIMRAARGSCRLTQTFQSEIYGVAVRSPTVFSLSRPLCASREGTERGTRPPVGPIATSERAARDSEAVGSARSSRR